MKEVLYEYRWRVWPIDFYGKINVHGPFYNLIFNWRPFNEQGIILSLSKYRLKYPALLPKHYWQIKGLY